MITEEKSFLGLEEIKNLIEKHTQHSRQETTCFLAAAIMPQECLL